jgi:pimeloyl-ACP methyl ester carboxylesterase
MQYNKDYTELKSVFNPDVREIRIPGSSVRIVNERFNSDINSGEFLKRADFSISENKSFSYPVFTPGNCDSRKAILLLHGLNERSWIKYLVWAYWLTQISGSYVILFPISFHINRAPSSWIDPRLMQEFVKERSRAEREIEMSTFANIALSSRLTEEPMRFFNSGYQTSLDIIKLLTQIRDGKHGVIPGSSRVNVFAYSIGAFLAQILMMGNPENLFSDSRLFMFCGGSVFSNMKGTSRLIMDSLAYNRIYSYYMNDFECSINHKNPFAEFLRSTQIGMAFRSMIDFGRFRSFRESILAKLKGQIRSVALKKDAVIPADGIVNTLKSIPGTNNNQVEIWDFPYPYSHENPFPVFSNQLSDEVDRTFERLFARAGLFLA